MRVLLCGLFILCLGGGLDRSLLESPSSGRSLATVGAGAYSLGSVSSDLASIHVSHS